MGVPMSGADWFYVGMALVALCGVAVLCTIEIIEYLDTRRNK